MLMINPSTIQIEFECVECKNIEKCDIYEAVYNGPPICSKCATDNEMSIINCFEVEK